jgi:hypothetical protein
VVMHELHQDSADANPNPSRQRSCRQECCQEQSSRGHCEAGHEGPLTTICRLSRMRCRPRSGKTHGVQSSKAARFHHSPWQRRVVAARRSRATATDTGDRVYLRRLARAPGDSTSPESFTRATAARLKPPLRRLSATAPTRFWSAPTRFSTADASSLPLWRRAILSPPSIPCASIRKLAA